MAAPRIIDLCFSAGNTAFLGIHGLAGAPKELEYLAKRLRDADITCEVPVLPGHGGTITDLKGVGWRDWLDFLEKRLLALHEKHGPVFVGGLCSGALLALALAVRQPKLVKGLILYSTTYFYDGWNSGPLGQWGVLFVLYSPMRWFFSFPNVRPPFGVKDPRLQRLIAAHLKRTSINHGVMQAGYSQIPAKSFAQMESLKHWVRRRLGNIHQPTLLMHSVADDMTSIRSSELVLKHLGSEDKKLLRLNDCYHMITLDQQKRCVAKETIGFIHQHMQLSGPSSAPGLQVAVMRQKS